HDQVADLVGIDEGVTAGRDGVADQREVAAAALPQRRQQADRRAGALPEPRDRDPRPVRQVGDRLGRRPVELVHHPALWISLPPCGGGPGWGVREPAPRPRSRAALPFRTRGLTSSRKLACSKSASQRSAVIIGWSVPKSTFSLRRVLA